MIVSTLLMHTSYVTCILCLARSLDLTYSWCLGIDPDYENDTPVEVPIAGDYGWELADQKVKLNEGVPTQGVWAYLYFGVLSVYVVSKEVDWYAQTYLIFWDWGWTPALLHLIHLIWYLMLLLLLHLFPLSFLCFRNLNVDQDIVQKVLNWTTLRIMIMEVLGFSGK